MQRILPVPLLGLAIAAWSSAAQAHEVVVLPGVVGPTGVATGVNTQGPGTLSVGEQNINTANEAGGAITTTAANTANIVFAGNSTVTGDVGAIGSSFLNIAAGANAKTVTFNGQVFSTTFTLTGTGTVNFNQGFVSNSGSTMDFAGDGFINIGAGQTVKAAITNTAGANTGTLTLNANSIFDGAVGAASGLKLINVVGGNALITGQVKAGTYSLGTNTLNVAGAFAIPVAGTINTTIFSSSLYGKIVPIGAATIGNGLKVNVTVTGPITNGTSFNIVDASSGTTGSTVIVTANTTRYAFSAAPTVAGLVKITTTQIPLAVIVAPVIGAPPGSSPTTPVLIAPVIDALPVTPVTAGLLTAITLLPTPAAVAAALGQLGPGASLLAAPRVAARTGERFQDLVTAHLDTLQICGGGGQSDRRRTLRQEDATACLPDDLRSHWWVSAFGEMSTQRDVGGYEGHDARTTGAMLAYDHALGDAAHVGIGFGYARSNIDAANSASQAEISSWRGLAYLGYAPGAWYVNGSLTGGSDKYTGARHVKFPGVDSMLQAQGSGTQLSALATTGYRFYLGDGRTIITPHADLRYTSLRTNAYTEFGDPALALHVAEQTYNFGQAGLGVRITRDTMTPAGRFFRPQLHADWAKAIGDDTMAETAGFASGGPTFATVGLRASRDTYDVGGGFVFGSGGRWSVEGAYDNVWRSQGYSAQRLMMTFAMHL